MIPKENNIAYIDGANLHKGVAGLGWKLDYRRFRVWLSDKYGVKTAYIFLGLVAKNKDLYTNLQEAGFVLVFKETTYDGKGDVKGNCDADLVLKAISDFYEKNFSKCVLVSSDGDYAGLVKFFKDRVAFLQLISPSNRCSFLLRKINIPILYLNDKKSLLEYHPKRKSPQ